MSGPDSDLLSPHLQELVAKGASKLVLNPTAVTQMDSWSIKAVAKTYASRKPTRRQLENTLSEQSDPGCADGGSLARPHPYLRG